jgi:hypothetical protein
MARPIDAEPRARAAPTFVDDRPRIGCTRVYVREQGNALFQHAPRKNATAETHRSAGDDRESARIEAPHKQTLSSTAW